MSQTATTRPDADEPSPLTFPAARAAAPPNAAEPGVDLQAFQTQLGQPAAIVPRQAPMPPSPQPVAALAGANSSVGNASRPITPAAAGYPATWVNAAPFDLQPALRSAEQHVQKGVALGSRGAVLSARDEFLTALSVLVEARDRAAGSNTHSRALAAGLKALDEAKDLVPRLRQLDSAIDLDHLSRAHETPVLRLGTLAQLTPSLARAAYAEFAEQQLAAACGATPIASVALASLGQLHAAVAGQENAPLADAAFKAETLHRAALWVDPNNFIAANDLGVLLARDGRLELARDALKQSLRTSPQPSAWQNLAKVHNQLGEAALAELAQREARQLEHLAAAGQRRDVLSKFPIVWVDPQTFAATAQPSADIQPTRSAPPSPPPAAQPRTWAERMPWNQLRR